MQAARESMVLLKNDGVLPVASTVKRIAVIGPSAADISVLEGNYNGTTLGAMLPVDAIRTEFAGKANVSYDPGSIYVDGAPATIPSSALRPEAGSTSMGLKGEYFDHSDFTGSPKVQRVDARIQFDWNRVSLAEGIPASGFAVRWTGVFVPPVPGMYKLSFRGRANSYQVFVDDKLALDGKGTIELDCKDTAPHTLKIEYKHSPDNTDVGLEWQPPDAALLAPAVELARSSDLIVAFAGLSPHLEGEEMNVHAEGFSGGDRSAIELPQVQEDLLHALKATGKPLIVVLTSGSAVASPWMAENADAILEAWYPGERGGQAIAETLSGAANPAGRLPITFYRATADLPPFENYTMADRTYRYFDGPVMYRFGYGLSYTNFRHTAPQLSSRSLAAGDILRVRTTVTNAGKVSGDDVLPLFLVPPAKPGAPRRQLVAFTRIHLRPGESKEVTLEVEPRCAQPGCTRWNAIDLVGRIRARSGSRRQNNATRTGDHVPHSRFSDTSQIAVEEMKLMIHSFRCSRCVVAAGVLGLLASAALAMGQSSADPASLVNPMIGTAHLGYTFPGAVVPFGMVSFSPNLLSATADRRNTPGGYIYDRQCCPGLRSHAPFRGWLCGQRRYSFHAHHA